MKNRFISSRKSGPPNRVELIILHVPLCWRCCSLPVSVSISRAIWWSCVKCHIDWYTVSFAAGGLSRKLHSSHPVRDRERSMPGLTASAHALAIEIVVFTAQRLREIKSNVWNTICMKLPYVAQQVGNAFFYRLTEIKELSGSLWWMHEVRNLLQPVAGWGLFCHVGPTGVVRH